MSSKVCGREAPKYKNHFCNTNPFNYNKYVINIKKMLLLILVSRNSWEKLKGFQKTSHIKRERQMISFVK